MKHMRLHAIAHNYADSLASGMSFVIGYCSSNVFADAAANPEGRLRVDFLNGSIEAEHASRELKDAVSGMAAAFPRFCAKHGVWRSAFRILEVTYATGHRGNTYTVAISDRAGRHSEITYKGVPGRRVRMLMPDGRTRPNIKYLNR